MQFSDSTVSDHLGVGLGQGIVKVGLLHSLTGTMAISEVSVRDAELMAIAEINARGGVLGHRVEPIIEDAASNPSLFAAKARKLLQQDQVATLFGCWTSASRKAVLPVLAEQNGLLWYPVQYEGLETSPHVFYLGSCPNQQVEPAIRWLLQRYLPQEQPGRFYLVGSDYVFPRTVHKIIHAQLMQAGVEVVGDCYVPLGSVDFGHVIDRIYQTQPTAIFNTLNGDSNVAFYQQFHTAGLTADHLPIVAFSIAEEELQRIGEAATGHFVARGYFQSLDTPINREFVERFQTWTRQQGDDERLDHTGVTAGAINGRGDRVTSAPVAAAYTQVYLWKQAVETAGSFAVDQVRQAAYGQMMQAPEGGIKLERNHHLWKACHIGQAQSDGQFKIVYSSEATIKPQPYFGLEEVGWDHTPVVTALLGEATQAIQTSCELEEKSRQLEAALVELTAANQELLELRQSNLIQTDKMSSLGQMVAGIAHEINNPINFIYGNLDHIRDYTEDLLELVNLYQTYYPDSHPEIQEQIEAIDLEFVAEDFPKLVESMHFGTARICEIVAALRNFSRLDEGSKRQADIHQGIDGTLLILQNRLKAKSNRPEIRVVKQYGHLPLVECYAGQLNQVFMNLISNAIDAIEEGMGSKEGRTDSQGMDREIRVTPQIFIHTTIASPNAVQIRISDNGPGIPEPLRERIFEPFFTTKPAAKGTGLGLSISHNIITERHGGSLHCESEPGQGTTFWIEIPVKGDR